MAVFSVISLLDQHPSLEGSINAKYANSNIKIAVNVWFITDKAVTTEEVCKKLNIVRDDPSGIKSAIVLKFDSYYGLAPRNVWEWLAVKTQES